MSSDTVITASISSSDNVNFGVSYSNTASTSTTDSATFTLPSSVTYSVGSSQSSACPVVTGEPGSGKGLSGSDYWYWNMSS